LDLKVAENFGLVFVGEGLGSFQFYTQCIFNQ
jgi:hypothetical protein